VTAPSVAVVDQEPPEHLEVSTSWWREVVTRLVHHPRGRIGLVIVTAVILLAVSGPWLAPHEYDAMDLAAFAANGHRPLLPFSPGHLLGTDQLGRDLFTRVLVGAQGSLAIAFIVQLMVILIGVPIGAVAGWSGGRVDAALMRFTDVISAFPELIFIILVTVTFIGTPLDQWLDGLFVIFVAIGLISWITVARLVRAEVLALKQREFVEAARALGLSGPRILVRHVMPNLLGTIVIAVSVGIPAAILAESTLSFLGLGVQPPRPSWGSLINYGSQQLPMYPHMVIVAVVPLLLTLVGFVLLGDGLRDALDPRLRRR
jgi:ABC-type dipeptide/oligopeptide/nickel transport system permease subunit